MAPKLLMIDDDLRLGEMVAAYLGGNGFDVTLAGSGEFGLAAMRSGGFAAVVLDLMLPDGNGLDFCRRIRALPAPTGSVPVLMLTAKGDPFDRVVGLEIGADDYLPKPFEPRELLARLRAVLRRTALADAPPAETLRFGRLEVDRCARAARVDGRQCPTTGYQFDLLVALAERAGRVLSRDQLMDALKGTAHEPFDRSIDVHVARLRAVLEDDPKHPRRILTVRGSGYVFARVQDD